MKEKEGNGRTKNTGRRKMLRGEGDKRHSHKEYGGNGGIVREGR